MKKNSTTGFSKNEKNPKPHPSAAKKEILQNCLF